MAKNALIKQDDSDIPGVSLKKDPEKYFAEELRRWLECHGVKKTGKKDLLTQRVRDSLLLNLPVDSKIDGGKWYYIKSSTEVVRPRGCLSATGWKHFPSMSLPTNFNYGHIYFHLVESADNLLINNHRDGEEELSGYI